MFLGGLGGGVAQVLRQALQLLRRRQVENIIGLVGEEVLIEGGEEASQLLVDLCDAFSGSGRKLGASPNEAVPAQENDALLFGRQARFVACFVDGLDAV